MNKPNKLKCLSLGGLSSLTLSNSLAYWANGKEATINRALDGSTYPSYKIVHSVFGKINYAGLKHNSLYLGLVLPSGGWQSLIHKFRRKWSVVNTAPWLFKCWISPKNCLLTNASAYFSVAPVTKKEFFQTLTSGVFENWEILVYLFQVLMTTVEGQKMPGRWYFLKS